MIYLSISRIIFKNRFCMARRRQNVMENKKENIIQKIVALLEILRKVLRGVKDEYFIYCITVLSLLSLLPRYLNVYLTTVIL